MMKTQQEALNWIMVGWQSSQYKRSIAGVGTGIDVDGLYGFQCKDFSNAYAEYMGAPFTGGNAIVLWNIAQKGWHRVSSPQIGDVFVRNYVADGINYGDTGVVKSVGNGTVRVVQQNLAGNLRFGSPPAEQTYNQNIMLGYLRRDNIGGIMVKFSKDQENELSIGVTGGLPGANYNYRYTGLEVTDANLNSFVQFWRSNSRISALEAQIADLKKNSCTTKERQFLDLRKQI